MSNQATPANASVISATCSDDRHPGSCVLDGSDKTFWFTTGMFPQELVIAFNGEVVPANVHITTRHVKHFTVFRCDKADPKSWEEMWKSGELDKGQDAAQITQKDFHSKSGLRYLKLRIDSGYEEFAAVHEVRVDGKTIGGASSSSSGSGDRD